MKSIQETYAPNNKCFGCGPSNSQGLQIKSMLIDNEFLAFFKPEPHHQAFENVLSGGICGTVLDCHSNWCAAYHIMKYRGESLPPCTVTAHFSVELLTPTPMDTTLKIHAHPEKIDERKAEIVAQISANDTCTARLRGLFVAVKEGHPAFHRW